MDWRLRKAYQPPPAESDMISKDIIKTSSQPIIVKLMARMSPDSMEQHFRRQLPDGDGLWGRCRFVFDAAAEEYDWLVVYHDLYRAPGSLSMEKLRCPREKTILITTEPSTITVYGKDYLRQYGTVITFQEPWVISHPNAVFTQPGLVWFYGFPDSGGHIRSYDELRVAEPPEKNKLISTVCSSRKGALTLHSRRVRFTEQLKSAIPELDIFGHGVKPMSDKAEALDPYQYHITIENHVYPHHLTEKLPDAFLGYTLPFYHGSPNAADYFPPESFIYIDIRDFKRSRDIIRSTIANNEYQDRLPYIIEARRRVLDEHNIFALLDRYISKTDGRFSVKTQSGADQFIMNRQTLRLKKPLIGIRSLAEKAVTKGKLRFLKCRSYLLSRDTMDTFSLRGN